MPLLMPAPSPRSSAFSSKSPGWPPCQIRYVVPTGFSHVDSATMAPFSTRQIDVLPSHPLSVSPSNMLFQPSWSLKSIGSGWVKPPPRPPRPPPPGWPGPPGPVAGGCCCAHISAPSAPAARAASFIVCITVLLLEGQPVLLGLDLGRVHARHFLQVFDGFESAVSIAIL